MMNLHMAKRCIEKVNDKELHEVFIDINDENTKCPQTIGLLDQFGAVLNRKEWVRFTAWEEESGIEAKVTVRIKPWEGDGITKRHDLFYVLRVWDIRPFSEGGIV